MRNAIFSTVAVRVTPRAAHVAMPRWIRIWRGFVERFSCRAFLSRACWRRLRGTRGRSWWHGRRDAAPQRPRWRWKMIWWVYWYNGCRSFGWRSGNEKTGSGGLDSLNHDRMVESSCIGKWPLHGVAFLIFHCYISLLWTIRGQLIFWRKWFKCTGKWVEFLGKYAAEIIEWLTIDWLIFRLIGRKTLRIDWLIDCLRFFRSMAVLSALEWLIGYIELALPPPPPILKSLLLKCSSQRLEYSINTFPAGNIECKELWRIWFPVNQSINQNFSFICMLTAGVRQVNGKWNFVLPKISQRVNLVKSKIQSSASAFFATSNNQSMVMESNMRDQSINHSIKQSSINLPGVDCPFTYFMRRGLCWLIDWLIDRK